LSFTLFGCVAGGPHLSINRDSGTTEIPGGVFEEIPVLAQDMGIMASGAQLAQSERFKTYGGFNAVNQGRAGGGSYRNIGAVMGLGQEKVVTETVGSEE
jgi:hypothetical protein